MSDASPEGADDFVYGIHAVERLVAEQPGRVRVIWVLREAHRHRLGKLLDAARGAGIRTELVERRLLDRRVHGAHQGVVAQCHAADLADEGALEAQLDRMPAPALMLALDGIQDPRNLGACLRSAEAAGVCAVLLPKRRSAPVSSLARKTASGAAEALFLVEVTNLVRRLVWLKERGLRVIGAAVDARERWIEADFRGPTVLVVGGEEKGLRALTRATCDELVALPMHGKVASLNVSVATGILLFEAVRQRSLAQRGLARPGP